MSTPSEVGLNDSGEKSGDPEKEKQQIPGNGINGATSKYSIPEVKYHKEPDTVAFSPESKMHWTPWFAYFESVYSGDEG